MIFRRNAVLGKGFGISRKTCRILWNIIKDLEGKYEKGVPEETILEKAEEMGVKRDLAVCTLKRLAEMGDIFRPRLGYYRVVQRLTIPDETSSMPKNTGKVIDTTRDSILTITPEEKRVIVRALLERLWKETPRSKRRRIIEGLLCKLDAEFYIHSESLEDIVLEAVKFITYAHPPELGEPELTRAEIVEEVEKYGFDEKEIRKAVESLVREGLLRRRRGGKVILSENVPF